MSLSFSGIREYLLIFDTSKFLELFPFCKTCGTILSYRRNDSKLLSFRLFLFQPPPGFFEPEFIDCRITPEH